MFWRLQHANRLHRYRLVYNIYLSSFRCDLNGSNFICPSGSFHNFLHVADQFVVKSLVCVSLNASLSYKTNLCSWKFVPFLLLDIPYSPLKPYWFVVIKLLPLHCNCCLQAVNLSVCYLLQFDCPVQNFRMLCVPSWNETRPLFRILFSEKMRRWKRTENIIWTNHVKKWKLIT